MHNLICYFLTLRQTDKPKHGGRKVFFHRLWCRIQRIPLPKFEKSFERDAPDKEDEELWSGKKRRKSVDSYCDYESEPYSDDHNSRHEMDGSDVECDEKFTIMQSAETLEQAEKFKRVESMDKVQKLEMYDEDNLIHQVAYPDVSEDSDGEKYAIFKGQVRLSREDDPHWLSDAHCFIRQELTEVFSAREEDLGPAGASEIGQVGIRCVYCAESKSPEDRPKGHVYYPSSISSIQQVVSDLQRR